MTLKINNKAHARTNTYHLPGLETLFPKLIFIFSLKNPKLQGLVFYPFNFMLKSLLIYLNSLLSNFILHLGK